MPAPKNPRPWTDSDERRLLLSIIQTHSIKIDYKLVAEHMGDGRTGNAIMKHLKKMKDSLNTGTPVSTDNSTGFEGGVTAPKTPKRKNTKAMKMEIESGDDGDEDKAAEVSPAKKSKTRECALASGPEGDETKVKPG